MGCNESKPRTPRPTEAKGSEPSTRYGAGPRKSVDTTSNGALSASPGCVDEGCPLEHATTSTSQCVATPLHSHHGGSGGGASARVAGSSERGSRVSGEKEEKKDAATAEAVMGLCEVQEKGGAATPSNAVRGDVVSPRLSAETDPTAATATSPHHAASSPHAIQQGGNGAVNVTRGTPEVSEKQVTIVPFSSPLSYPASTPAVTPLKDSPALAAAAFTLDSPSLGTTTNATAASAAPLLLLPPPSCGTSETSCSGATALSLTRSNNTSTHPASATNVSRAFNSTSINPSTGTTSAVMSESNNNTNASSGTMYKDGDSACPLMRTELSGTATTMNSTFFVYTVASTQPPSMQGSRSASAAQQPQQPGLTPVLSATHAAPVVVVRTPTRSPATRFPLSSSDEMAGASSSEPVDVLSPHASRGSPRHAPNRSPRAKKLSDSQSSRCRGGLASSSTTAGSPTAPTQPPSTHTECRVEAPPQPAASPRTNTSSAGSSGSPSPQPQPAPQSSQKQRGQATPSPRRHGRTSSSGSNGTVGGDGGGATSARAALAASPRPHSPSPSSSTSRTPVLALSATAVSVSAADVSDAPHDVPLPEIEELFAVSPMCSASAAPNGGNHLNHSSSNRSCHTNNNNNDNNSVVHNMCDGTGANANLVIAMSSVGSASLGGAPSPRRFSGSGLVAHSPVGPSVTVSESESYNAHYAVTGSGGLGLTSPYAPHLHGTNNNSSNNGVHNSPGAVSSNVSWLMAGGMETAGASGSLGAGSNFGGPNPNNGPAALSSTGTPPTNSELVRQINQPTTNIKSILRKRAGSAATTASAPHGLAGSGVDVDGATTTTTFGGSGAHSRVLSLSLTNTVGNANGMGGAGGSASSPRLFLHDGRASTASSSLPDVALRTDFITTRHSNSETDMISSLGAPHLAGLASPNPGLHHRSNSNGNTNNNNNNYTGHYSGLTHTGGSHHLRSPPSSFGLNNANVGSAPLSLSGETSLTATVTSAGGNGNDANTTTTTSNNNNYSISAGGRASADGAVGSADGAALPSSEACRARNSSSGGRRSPAGRVSPTTSSVSSPGRRPFVNGRAPTESPAAAGLPAPGSGKDTDVAEVVETTHGSLSGAELEGVVIAGGGRTSDEPPPDIMLVAPPKRVHVVV